MQFTFAGVGSAFADQRYYQSNLVLTARSGKRLLLDCGTDARFSLGELGVTNANVGTYFDGVYISHIHADHMGGLEWLAFCSYFNPNAPRPKLYIGESLIGPLWESLRHGLQSLEDKVATLETYFDVRPIWVNGVFGQWMFEWEGITAEIVPVRHVFNGPTLQPGFGLYMYEHASVPGVYWSADTTVTEAQARWRDRAAVIFHDCETAPYSSGVHASYKDLVLAFDKATRAKTWLYHYQPDPPQDAVADGFRGFVHKGQTFQF